jgi:N-acetylglucosamine-6-phosphate deacetylase
MQSRKRKISSIIAFLIQILLALLLQENRLTLLHPVSCFALMSSQPLLIRGGLIVRPSGTDKADILCRDGFIAEIGQNVSKPAGTLEVDASGMLIFPGFIDSHCHGAAGCDTCDGSVGAIRTIANRKSAEGVTTWLPTTMTLPPEALRAAASAVAEYSRQPTGARTPGLHIEGPFLNRDFIGAQNPEYLRLPDWAEIAALRELHPILQISLAPELPGALSLIRRCLAEGIRTSAAHSGATREDFLSARKEGLGLMTHFCNQMSPLHHREIGLVGCGLLDRDFPVELICDGLHVCPDMLDLIFRTKSPSSILLVSDSMAASWMPDGPCSLGGREVMVKNGVARVAATGALAGTTLRMNEAVARAAALTGHHLPALARYSSANHASVLGFSGKGDLVEGYDADLVLLEENFSVRMTVAGGAVVYDPALPLL